MFCDADIQLYSLTAAEQQSAIMLQNGSNVSQTGAAGGPGIKHHCLVDTGGHIVSIFLIK